MRLILLPLVIIIAVGVFNKATNMENISYNNSSSYYFNPSLGTWVSNSSTTTGQTGAYNVPTIDLIGIDGIIALVIAFVALGTAIGIHFLGSGLSDVSVMIIYKSLFFYSLWSIFSILGFTMITSIPMFGIILYIVLTVIYSLGVVQTIGFGNGG